MNTKKKVFISYKFTGENLNDLGKIIPQIHSAIEKAGHNHYSTFFDNEQFKNEKWSQRQIFHKAYEEIEKSDLILFFVNSAEISRGMLIELGYSLAKRKRIILAINKQIKENIFRNHIEEVVEFNDIEDLTKKIASLKL